jgi:dTDP-4-dehydrorhamnose reductase
MRILITGVSGLLRSTLPWSCRRNHQVVGLANQHSLQRQKLPAGRSFEVVQADLTMPGLIERCLNTAQPDWIIHCAALANLEACEANPDLAHKLNAEVPGELAALAAKLPAI